MRASDCVGGSSQLRKRAGCAGWVVNEIWKARGVGKYSLALVRGELTRRMT